MTAASGNALTRDEVFANSASFAVDLPDGSYTVTAIAAT